MSRCRIGPISKPTKEKNATMKPSFFFVSLLATSALAAPAPSPDPGPALEARSYSCNPLHGNPCPAACAAGSQSINCSASWCEETSAPNKGVCVCSCHY
ncbi:hypothetical protein B0T26DRAFT_7498 [Lasiosphaeria miniovina]|uniref:Uncharacterized protein n=1 Tax=Lasiosphaeria miniovina TaxID=1954250 RepID=A0AA40BFC2_9PEZI|nr:uncharacterized protein B0T26DRAFT_7498 [Lasiosphaeria miniovina]KAK0733217.1 hypothetical protein B0T26DRAFT_7498 [Lasiosphaeria miniovina]